MLQELVDKLIRHWPYCVAGLILFAGIVIAIITLSLASSRRKTLKEELEKKVNSSRIYIIDMRTEQVRDFNVMAPHAITKAYPIASFYNQFPKSEQSKVIQWINAVYDRTVDAPDYLEIDIHGGKNKNKTYFSMLQIESSDDTTGMIHLRSYIMKSIDPSTGGTRSKRSRSLASMKQYETALKNAGRKKGVSIVYRFCYRRIQDKDRVIDPLIINQIKNVISPHLTSRRLLLQLDGNELLLADFHIPGKPNGLALANECFNAIKRYLALNGLLTKIDIRAAVVEHKLFLRSESSIVEEAKHSALVAYSGEVPIYYYEKGKESLAAGDETTFRTEVERIIHENKILINFRPIYSVYEESVFGYLLRAELTDTYFSSMDDLHDYAAKTGDDKDLFATIARNSIPTYVNENKNPKAKLFYRVNVDDREFLLTTFAKLKSTKDANIVFLFKENDIKSHFDANHPEDVVQDMKLIKAKGFQAGLLLEEGELTLPSVAYTAFDFFVCGFSFAGSASAMDAKIRSKLHSLVEKLLRYNKPIIASDIEGWDAIEVIVRSGIKYISADAFCPYTPMIHPVSTKSVKKVRDMKN